MKTTKDKTFKGEGLGYFKEIIKSTIAEKLAADEEFVEKIYTKITDKLINNDSTNLSNLFSKIKSRLTDSISSVTLSRSDGLLIMSSSSIQKTPVPKQLIGIPYDFNCNSRYMKSSTIYWSDCSRQSITIDLGTRSSVAILFYKSDDDGYIYLDIDLDIPHQDALLSKAITVKYIDETEIYIVYIIDSANSISMIIPIYKGWYVQKRIYKSGKSVPRLLKV